MANPCEYFVYALFHIICFQALCESGLINFKYSSLIGNVLSYGWYTGKELIKISCFYHLIFQVVESHFGHMCVCCGKELKKLNLH